ncbi:ATP-binding cassette domain-containing protein [Achromobacter sp. UBA5777]|uniref:ATP-binding cassette domain-containing protein n=1 Tax=Achromobacter sp. UBA5777 TaxID=1945913 RepID=UPI0025B8F636|nr:ATP-binding cassette domain-containing protein [Achromobacter sp. UBA5777]
MNTQPRSLSPLVQLERIRKSFDGKDVISDLNLTINDGEFLTLLGPSGCGKTTVLRLIAGLESVDNGHIHLENQDITQVPAEDRHVNTVFQSYALFPHMTVFENVAFGLRMQKTPASEIPPRVTEALRMVQLEAFAQRKPHQLSGGQQQQLAIGRALASRPRLLILDEPTEGIQPSVIKEIGQVIRSLANRGDMAILLVEQFYDFAAELADRYLVMSRGSIVQQGRGENMEQEGVRGLVAI